MLLLYISITWYYVACECTMWSGRACKHIISRPLSKYTDSDKTPSQFLAACDCFYFFISTICMTFVDICRRHINLFLFALIARKRGQTFVSPIEFFEQLVLVTMRINVYFLRRKIGIVLPSLDFDTERYRRYVTTCFFYHVVITLINKTTCYVKN